mgnify:CR=1 FL=1
MKLGSVALLAAALFWAPVADAKTFRWANDGDVNSLDPYARQETFLLSFTANIYEPLVRRDRDLKLEAALATEWTQTAPTVWRFELRRNVKFHDGAPFTADDVVFSADRLMRTVNPRFRVGLQSVQSIKALEIGRAHV